MERNEALKLLRAIEGADLVEIATRHQQKIFHEKEVEGRIKRTINKGWAGLTLEAYLGLPKNSRREPNAGSWELKQVSVKKLKRTGEYTAKETMQITMVDWEHVRDHPFEESHVLHKIGRMIVVARLYVDKNESESPLVIVRAADLSLEEPEIYNQVKEDYEEIRASVIARGFAGLKSEMGKLIQARTKGQANSTTRAFYARTNFVNILLGLKK